MYSDATIFHVTDSILKANSVQRQHLDAPREELLLLFKAGSHLELLALPALHPNLVAALDRIGERLARPAAQAKRAGQCAGAASAHRGRPSATGSGIRGGACILPGRLEVTIDNGLA